MQTAPYAYRDQSTLIRALGLSVKAAADFTPHGCLNIIGKLEASPATWAKGLLTAERRGYCALYSSPKVIPLPKLKPVERNPRLASELAMEVRAARKFGG